MTIQQRRKYHRERRRIAKALRICLSCNEAKAAPGRTKCHQCATIAAHERAVKRTADRGVIVQITRKEPEQKAA